MPYVSNGKHLGNILVFDFQIKSKNICLKRGITIGKLNCVLREFHFAHALTNTCIVLFVFCAIIMIMAATCGIYSVKISLDS